ncbi:MAG TPA: hypothetical protein VF257_15010 [Solirubrobacteraceae bacterium]
MGLTMENDILETLGRLEREAHADELKQQFHRRPRRGQPSR